MNLNRILFGIISFSFLFTHLIFQLNAMEINKFKETAKNLTILSAKTTSKLAADLAEYLEDSRPLTSNELQQAQEAINCPEAQKTITSMQAYGELFEEFTQEHPHFYLAAKGFVGIALIGTTLYLVYKTGALYKADTVLGFIKKNPEITAMTLLTLLGTSLYAAKEIYPESSASSLFSNLGGGKGIAFLTLTAGFGIKLINWLTSNQQVKSENQEEEKNKLSSWSSIEELDNSSPSTSTEELNSSPSNRQIVKREIINNLQNFLHGDLHVISRNLAQKILDFLISSE